MGNKCWLKDSKLLAAYLPGSSETVAMKELYGD